MADPAEAFREPTPPTQDWVTAAFRREHGTLVRLAAVVTGDVDAAHDIVGEAFADLLAATAVREPGAWLRLAVTRRSTSWVRRQVTARRYLQTYGATHVDRATDSPTQAAPETIALDERIGDRVTVRDALARLDHEQRAAIFLRYYLDRPEREIAQALGCRPGTVKSRLSRAMRRLREELS